jgi:uncharacterized membrane protein YeaQ/YmgE (transglycosylase-associated protein family)
MQSQAQHYAHDWRALLILMFVGAVAGLLAELIVGSVGFPLIVTMIIGIIGSWLGDVLFGGYLDLTSNPLLNLIFRSTAGAIILVVIFSIIFRMRKKDRTDYRA